MPFPLVSSDGAAAVGRLAPSPTGRLHLGHARSFLIAWWSARSQGGRVVLRIEDLDASRVKPGSVERVLEDLAWLGIDWDGAPVFQSSRVETYRAALEPLVRTGAAYACVCTRKEIDAAATAPHAEDAEQRYPGTCRGRFESLEHARAETGRDAALRLRVNPGPITIDDELHGPFTVDVGETVGDFVIARKDGIAAYQFATPFDDAEQGVTEVVRGDDLLPSAARQWLVLEALGLPHPKQLHIPLVVDAAGNRLAKRAGSLSLEELRLSGVTPGSITTWAARSLGFASTSALQAASDALRGFPDARIDAEPLRLSEDPLRDLRSL